MSFVRVGQFAVQSGKADEVRKIYEAEAIPLIRAASGNISAFLLQQHQSPESFLAVTIWRTKEDAANYESSGAARQMVEKIRFGFAGPPILTTYDSFGI